MKKTKAFIVFPLIGVLLTGCVGKKHYEESKYILSTVWEGDQDYRILQLGDIHFSQSDDHELHFKVIDRTVKASNPDMIVINGDAFTFADKHVVKKLFKHIDSYGKAWTFAYGNHDDQGYYSDTYIQRLLASNEYKNVKFVNLEDDDVTGRSNFVINLTEKDNESNVYYQVYLFESHNYNFATGGYDYLKQDQIDWYERMVKYSKEKYGADIKNSMYMHIGFTEFCTTWDQIKDTDKVILGNMEEWTGSPEKDLKIFDKIKELGATQSVSASHDHANDSVVLLDGVYLCFGVHATNRIYNDENGAKIGGSLIKVNKATKNLTFENYYTSYDSEEVKMVSSEGGAE